jgi:hypothetical protein
MKGVLSACDAHGLSESSVVKHIQVGNTQTQSRILSVHDGVNFSKDTLSNPAHSTVSYKKRGNSLNLSGGPEDVSQFPEGKYQAKPEIQ